MVREPLGVYLEGAGAGGDAQRRQVQALEAAVKGVARLHVVAHAVVRKVREVVSQRGQLPVQHGRDLRRALSEEHVVDAVVPVHEHRGGLCAGGQAV